MEEMFLEFIILQRGNELKEEMAVSGVFVFLSFSAFTNSYYLLFCKEEELSQYAIILLHRLLEKELNTQIRLIRIAWNNLQCSNGFEPLTFVFGNYIEHYIKYIYYNNKYMKLMNYSLIENSILTQSSIHFMYRTERLIVRDQKLQSGAGLEQLRNREPAY